MEDMFEWCLKWCNDLTHNQMVMLEKGIRDGNFHGVAREIGGIEYWPLVSLDAKGHVLKVIDPLGYYRLPSKVGIKSYWDETS